MRKTTIRIGIDTANQINQLKYKWELNNHNEVIIRLMEKVRKYEQEEKK